MKKRLLFDAKRCTGCYACHIACLDAHCRDAGEIRRSFRGIQTVRYPEEAFQKTICPGCTNCGACRDACPSGAVWEDAETGILLIDGRKCTGCGMCAAACPLQLIRIQRDGKAEKCDGCIVRLREDREPACVRACPADAIRMEEVPENR